MAIDPNNTDAVAIPQLDDLVLALESFLVGSNDDGKMGKFTAEQLAEFIAPYISALGASPFVANTGSPLPNPIEKPTAITFVGIGDFDQTTGSNVVTTDELNVLFWSSNGATGTWTLGVEVPIDLTDYALKIDYMSNDDYVIESKNLFDKSLAEGVSIAANGGEIPQANWCSTGFIPILPSTEYSQTNTKIATSTSLAIAFYTSGQVFISGIPLTGLLSYTATSPSNAAFARCTIANAVGIGSNPTDNIYSNAFMFNEGDPLPWQAFGEKLINPEKVGTVAPPISNSFKNGYYEFSTTGSTLGNKEKFIVYTRISNSNFYAGFQIAHEFDMSDAIYTDQFRIISAKEYDFSTGVMVDTGKLVLNAGESECVYRTGGRNDFTGGFHGDETYQKIFLFADGIEVPITDNITLTSFNNDFRYMQESTTHQAPATDGTPVPGHPVEFIHHKITTISDGGYKTFNRLISQQVDLQVSLWYHGISCIGKPYANIVSDDYLREAVMTGSSVGLPLLKGARSYFGEGSLNKMSSQATSKLILPLVQDENCELYVDDRTTDTKYYRKFTPIAHAVLDEVWESYFECYFKREA